jgi:UDP-galactopyranose mutase
LTYIKKCLQISIILHGDELSASWEVKKYFRLFKFKNLFDVEIIKVNNFQGNAIINYTDENVPFTRIIEHKHFEKISDNNSTIITKEFPKTLDKSSEKYYPINNVKNNILYDIYLTEFEKTYKNIILGGRLACYKYLDMHQVIGQAMHKFKK